MADENLYDSEEAAPEQPMKEGGGDEGEQSQDEGATFMVNKDVCPDMQPGDTLTGKILRVHDDQYEVSVVSDDEAEAAPEEAETPSGPPSAMAGMMT